MNKSEKSEIIRRIREYSQSIRSITEDQIPLSPEQLSKIFSYSEQITVLCDSL